MAACQPWPAMSFCATGATRKVPNEPIPATSPSVALRLAGATTRDVAASDRFEAVQDSEMPISTPVPRRSDSEPVANTVTTRPAEKHSAPNISMMRMPKRSAIAPTKGWLMPQHHVL